MQDSIFNNLHGVVECYENGKKKWTLSNKITTLGRVALLSTMARDNFFWGLNSGSWLKQNGWEFDYNNAFISCFAVGNGGVTNDNGLPAPAKFENQTLTTIVPMLDKASASYNSSIYPIENFVDIYGQWPSGASYADTDTLIEDRDYAVENSNENNAVTSTKDYFYFKKVINESKPTAFSFSNQEVSPRYYTENSDLIDVKCAIARFKLEVVGRELMTVVGSEDSVAINELSLYISGIYERQRIDGRVSDPKYFSYPSIEPTQEQIEAGYSYPIIPGPDGKSHLYLPIQFSRVTFPTEVFDTDEKNITFIYNVFA